MTQAGIFADGPFEYSLVEPNTYNADNFFFGPLEEEQGGLVTTIFEGAFVEPDKKTHEQHAEFIKSAYNAATKAEDLGFDGMATVGACAELASAVQDLLYHAGIADANAEDVDAVDHSRERSARALLTRIRKPAHDKERDGE